MQPFIVTGTPRSATGYASLLFQELAIPCSHERIFKPRGALSDVLGWYTHGNAGESSWLAWAFLGLLPDKVPILRTLRNPWKVVDSLAFRNALIPKDVIADRGLRKFREAIAAYCPEVDLYDDPINRAAAFVLRWNQLIDDAIERYEFPHMSYHVEDMDLEQLGSVLDFLDIYRDEGELKSALEAVPLNVNGGKRVMHNVDITNPLILDALREFIPDEKPKIRTLRMNDTPRSPNELQERMDPQLCDGLRELASEQGYWQDGSAVLSEEKEGVLAHGT